MMTLNNIPREAYTVSKAPGLPMARMLTSAIPFVALAVPGAAYAQSASNTATITAPAGAIETNTANNSATDTDTILAALVATNDTATGVFGGGATDVISVLGNDTVNGAGATTSDVTITVASGSSVPAGLTFDTTDGTVDVTAGTAAGTYTFDYTICETANSTNCETATVSVTVQAPAIVADDDSAGPINGLTGGADILDVIAGDTLDGNAVTAGDVDISVVTGATPISGGPVPTLNTTTGLVSVPASTPAGVYTIDYRICDPVNPTVCDDGTATITVAAAPIVADDDSVTGIDGTAGAANALDIIPGDTLNGAQVALADVTLSVVTAATPISGGPVPSLNVSTGIVSVPANTPAGTYNITYEICEDLNPSNCDQAIASVTVDAPAIVADDDSVTGVDGVAGAADVLDVIDGDTLAGAAITAGDVDISVVTAATPISGGPVPTLNITTGLVSVPANTPAGTYSITYRICDPVNPTNCDDGVASITVDAPTITADADSVSGLNGVTGGTDVLNVLDGDFIGGVPATTSNVDLTLVTPATPIGGGPVPTLDLSTGQVQIPAGTPAGTYEIVYQICDPLNPTNCATETATIIVAPSVDLAIAKTNNVTEVSSGQTVTYELTVSNSGPDTATGAVLADTPGAGLTCPAGNPVTFSGSGIPSGTFTVGDLTGAGITLGSLANGESITVTYSCTVN